jgi:hypothetical protein
VVTQGASIWGLLQGCINPSLLLLGVRICVVYMQRMVRSIFSTGQVPLLEGALNQGLSSSREFMVRCAATRRQGLGADDVPLSFGTHDPARPCPSGGG